MTLRWNDYNCGWMQKLSHGWGILLPGELDEEVGTGPRVVNALTGEITKVPEGWAWDNWMEFLHS